MGPRGPRCAAIVRYTIAAQHENLNVYLSTKRRIICLRIQPYASFGIVCTTELPTRRLGAQSDEYSIDKDMKVV